MAPSKPPALFGLSLIVVVALLVLGVIGTGRAQGPEAAVRDVVVVNSTTQPVPVFDVSTPAEQPFAQNVTLQFLVNDNAGSGVISVPADKRLIVEQVSYEVSVPTGSQTPFAEISLTTGGVFSTHYVPLLQHGTMFADTVQKYVAGQPTRLYADPGTLVRLRVEIIFAAFGDRFARGAISGRLVNVR